MAKGLYLVLGGIIVIGIISNSSKNDTATSPQQAVTKPEPKKPTVDKSEKMQKGRQELLGKLMGEKVFTKYEAGTTGTARAYVAPRFYTLDFDQKQNFVGVVFAYYFDGAGNFDMVRLIDSRTNKTVGSFTQETGLKLD